MQRVKSAQFGVGRLVFCSLNLRSVTVAEQCAPKALGRDTNDTFGKTACKS
jgi:hypothetical protein